MDMREWFETELDASECASVKRFYLDFGLIENSDCSCFLRLMWMCRIITADSRLVWENISSSFVEVFERPVDLWNEQLAAKLLQSRLDCMDNPVLASKLREELDEHLVKTLKPPTTLPHVGFHATVLRRNKKEKECPYIVVPAAPGVEGSLVCNTPLQGFTDLLHVPRERMFFIDTVVRYCELGRVVHASPELSAAFCGEEPLLILSLIYERYVPEVSHWCELLSSCPSEYPTVPSYWGVDDLLELEGLDVLDDVLAKKARLVQFHAEIMPVLSLIYEALDGLSGLKKDDFLGYFTIETVMWARATFDSRAFNLNVDGRVVLALVPVADMINHSNRSDVLVRKVGTCGGDFVMQIGASLTADDVGRELWMSYGPLQNWELLQFYGFVIEDNEYDKLPFPFSMPEVINGDEWDERRAALVSRYSLSLAGSCWIGYSGRPPPALCALLRIHLASAEEFEMMERNGPFMALSPETENRIVSTISETVGCLLESLGTSLEEDERLLETWTCAAAGGDCAEGVLSRNRRLGTILRVGLKRIAHRALRWCGDAAAADTAVG